MRIAHVVATFPPYLAGTGNVCFHNALELAQRGHQVTVFTADRFRLGYVYPDAIAVRHLPVLFRVGNAPFLPSLLRLGSFDVLHLHYPFFFGAEMVFLRSLVGRLPYVVTYHQDVLLPGALGIVTRLHHRALGQWILRQARIVLATSWDYARSSRLASLLRARSGRVHELPNGVDPTRFHPDLDAGPLRARYGVAPAAPIILLVGALDRPHYFKGVPLLLEAFARLRHPRARLLIVGEGDLRGSYQQRAAQMGLGEQVVFCGRVSDDALPAHYAIADLLVLPSTTLGEAFGVVVLEAMASGKPVITSNLPGVRSVVTNGQDGLLVRPGDPDDLAEAIQTLLEDPGRRRAMGEQGRAKVEQRYTWQTIGGQLEEIYQRVVGRSVSETSPMVQGTR